MILFTVWLYKSHDPVDGVVTVDMRGGGWLLLTSIYQHIPWAYIYRVMYNKRVHTGVNGIQPGDSTRLPDKTVTSFTFYCNVLRFSFVFLLQLEINEFEVIMSRITKISHFRLFCFVLIFSPLSEIYNFLISLFLINLFIHNSQKLNLKRGTDQLS